MKKIIFSLVFLATLSQAFGQGIEFFKGTFDEALAKAKAENKVIFMDAFTEWCGPCKRMAATVFPDPKVGKYFNDNFVNVKMDMEKGEGPALSRKYDVAAYPTLLFLNGKGDLVHKAVGALPVDALLSSGKQALSKTDNLKDLEKVFADGKRDPEFLLQYIRALNRNSKPTLKIVNDFLQKADMKEAMTQKIIFEGTTQSDSKIFDLLIKNRKEIGAFYNEAQINEKIEAAIVRTLENAVEFKSAELHKEAKDKMKTYLPTKAAGFALEADMKFYRASSDTKSYCRSCEAFIKKEAKNDARQLYLTAKQMTEAFPDNKDVMQDAEKYLKRATENGGLVEYYLLYAQTLRFNGKKADALNNAEKALKIANESQRMLAPMVQDLIEKIKQG